MNPSNSQKVALAGGVLMGATVLVSAGTKTGKEKKRGATFNQLWQIAALTLVLAVAADFAPQVIVPLTAAIVIGFYFTHQGVLGPLFGTTAKKGG